MVADSSGGQRTVGIRDKTINNKTTVWIVVLAVVLLALPMALKVKRDHDIAASTYRLVSVNGQKPPYTPRHRGQQSPEIVSGTINLFSDGTFRATMTYKNPSGGTVTRDFKGTYTGTGAISSLNWEGSGETPVTLEENKLTMDSEGVSYVYEK